MPRKRQPWWKWKETRLRIWERDERKCVHCGNPLELNKCQIDHIKSGKLGSNTDDNLRTLCWLCHALRADRRHDGLRGKLMHKDLLPPNWRDLLWE